MRLAEGLSGAPAWGEETERTGMRQKATRSCSVGYGNAARLHSMAWLIAGLLACGLTACSVFPFGGGGDPPGEPGQPPAFEMDAAARLEPSGQIVLNVRMTLPQELSASRQLGRGTAARVRWTVEILARPAGQQLHETSWVQSLPDSVEANSLVSRAFEVPPGALLVAVTAEDEATGEGFTARQDVQVPEPDGPLAILGTRIEALRGRHEWSPQVSRTVSVDLDSLRVLAQVINGSGQEARVLVERLRVDSSSADPPFAMGRQPGSLSVRGIEVEDHVRDTTFVHTHALRDGLVELVVPLPKLEMGAYRIRVEAGGTPQDRFLVVRRVGFPKVERVGDLIAPMRYIATESEMRALTARLDPFLQRRAFDRFWGDRIPDRRLAASTIRAYSERVEEANRRFSNHKEGWKTDQGMALILFGLPQRVERTFGLERWIYSAGPVSGLALDFEATPDLPRGWPHQVWVLRRGPAYDVAWQRARRAWRRGDVP